MSEKCKIENVGGQAVIEGVMMRAGDNIATAVRRKNGTIETRVESKKMLSKKNKFFGLPIIRGALNLIDMLSIGISSLNWSAEIAEADEREAAGEEAKKTATWPSLLFGLVIGVGLFVLLPMVLSKLFGFEKDAFLFNLIAGAFRLTIFFVYLIGISFLPDIKRLFQYHGAEHKTIFAFEEGLDVTLDNARGFTTHHPRCGTSFIIIVAGLSILFFAIADSLIALIFDYIPPILIRFMIHLALWPLLVGVCYEALKFSAYLSTRFRWARFLVWPGLWVQRITTIEPTDDMLEVAIASLKAAVGIEDSEIQSPLESTDVTG
ncbi:MAG: DUF1385 domain-containing protein [bacterium]